VKKAIFDVNATPLQRGVTLIEASAGTGKTFSLAGIILRLIVEEHVPLREILAVTFTIAATAELKERVRRRLSEALDQLRRGETKDPIIDRVLTSEDVARVNSDLQVALESFDEAQVFTIHSFCQRTLQDYAFETGTTFDAELVTDPTTLFPPLVADFWRIKICQAPPLIAALILAWKRSPTVWTKLLEQLRNHPDAVVLPSANHRSSDELGVDLAADLQELCAVW
jgi:exodeoxyribonuclease V beta subunit